MRLAEGTKWEGGPWGSRISLLGQCPLVILVGRDEVSH